MNVKHIIGLMEDYKKFGGEILEDLGQYCRDYVKENPDIIVSVGCDSKQLRRKTLYAVVVCFQHPGNGVHVVFARKRLPKIRDLFTRLWNEAEFSRELGDYLEKELRGSYVRKLAEDEEARGMEIIPDMKLVDIHLDFNPSKERGRSNMVFDSAVGMIRGCGYRVRTKQHPDSGLPNAWAATAAADMLCK